MATFFHRHGRRGIFFTDHALDRWWERCEENGLHGRQQAMDLLRDTLGKLTAEGDPRSSMVRHCPPWARLSLWHRARAEGFLLVNGHACFVINRNGGGDFVAVTYIERGEDDDP